MSTPAQPTQQPPVPPAPASPAASIDPAVLALLRCPATKEPLREITKTDGTRVLVNASGTREYAFVRGIPVLVAQA